MRSSFHFAWAQLSFHRTKLLAAAAGVVVAVMLMLVQLGIRQGAIDNSVAIARRVTSELVVISPRTLTIFHSSAFPRRLLFRLPAHRSVAAVTEMYMGQAKFRNPWDRLEFPISVYGLDPAARMMRLPGFDAREEVLRQADRVLFDGLSRTNFGPIAEEVREHGFVDTEVNTRRVRVVDTIDVGISINTDGNLYTTPSNFLRLFPNRDPGAIEVGLVRLKPGADVESVRAELLPLVGHEAKILTRDELIAAEQRFLRESAPVDFIFGMGAAVGFFIGFVVVYQILYTEVINHLPQYATLKAVGFPDHYLVRVVLNQAFLLSVMGYVPGFFLAIGLYRVATVAIQMPFSMTAARAITVYLLTLMMCGLSALVAVRKVRTADPADVF